MNRNVESHFAQIPSVDIERSIFDRSCTHKTSFNVGELIPFYVDEVLPGDSFRVTTSKVVRLQTLLTPIMDDVYLDTYFFFVPNRLIWTHWKEFMGENNTSAWIPSTTYQVPKISSPASTGFQTGTLADYMGLPVNKVWTASMKGAPMALPFRAYAKIVEDWFRSEVLTTPLNIPMGDSNQTGTNGSSYVNDIANGGKPFVACKYFDCFTSCLPSPQKSFAPVTLPLLEGSLAPVGTMSRSGGSYPTAVYANLNKSEMTWATPTNPTTRYAPTDNKTLATAKSSSTLKSTNVTVTDANMDQALVPYNLVADLGASVGAVTINELRLAFQLQKFYEKCARSGSRYIELLRSHFGVTSPDGRIQRSEYLGGNRIPLSVHEVTNSAQSTNDFLGDLGAKSATSDIHEDFEKSFTEHGWVIGVCVARYDHTYTQNIERFWTRSDMTDYYFPVFANIGEVPVFTNEIYYDENSVAGQIFGYQEAWYDYRYKPNRCSGEMRPGIANTLASWHLADNYTSAPTLSDSWLREDKSNVDRVLAVTSSVSNQIFADIYIQNIATRCMPTYSIPGLIDHH